jgi:hypothetical protein
MTQQLTESQVAELKRFAELATPGQWEYGPAQNYTGFYIAPRGTLPTLASVERCGVTSNVQVHNFPGKTEANAAYIAAANPQTILALIADRQELQQRYDAAHSELVRVNNELGQSRERNRELREKVERLERTLDKYGRHGTLEHVCAVMKHSANACDCGFDEAFKPVEGVKS